jgi:hypothetical protein
VVLVVHHRLVGEHLLLLHAFLHPAGPRHPPASQAPVARLNPRARGWGGRGGTVTSCSSHRRGPERSAAVRAAGPLALRRADSFGGKADCGGRSGALVLGAAAVKPRRTSRHFTTVSNRRLDRAAGERPGRHVIRGEEPRESKVKRGRELSVTPKQVCPARAGRTLRRAGRWHSSAPPPAGFT